MISIRDFKKTDSDLLLTYLNDEKVTQYITDAIPQPYTQQDANWWLTQGSNIDLTKVIECNGVFVGCISAKIGGYEYNRSAEIGYWVGHKYWNQGIATQAVKQFSENIFNTTDIVRLFVSVVSENLASIRVLEKNNFIHHT